MKELRMGTMLCCVVSLLAMGVVVAGSAAPVIAADETRLKTRLTGPDIGGLVPSGAAEFRKRGINKRFTTEVEDVNLTGSLRVCVNGMDLGTISLASGFGDLNLDTRDGQTVPGMSSGNVVTVRSGGTDCSTGTAILIGELASVL